MERISKRLDKYNSRLSVNKVFNVKTNITQTNRLFAPNEINRIVNQYDEFELERNLSTKYRVFGTIKTLFSNPLFEVDDSNDDDWGITSNNWGIFDEPRFRDKTFPPNGINIADDEDLTYRESFHEYLKEVDGWFGYYEPFDVTNPQVMCSFREMTPNSTHFEFTPINGVSNWGLSITYPYSIDDSHFLVDGGLYISEVNTVEIGGRVMNTFRTPVGHGLISGDNVSLSGLSPAIANGTYRVKQLGGIDGSMAEYIFVVDTSREPVTSINNGRLRKVIGFSANNRRESRYYYRLFKTITEDNDYELYPLSFGKNIFSDQTVQYNFNGGSGTTEDIDIGSLRDNLGRPLSEIYLTIVKKENYGFGSISSGLNVPLNENDWPVLDIPDVRLIHNGTSTPFDSHTPLETNITVDQGIYYGDIVEYNDFTLEEVVLSEVRHRFNTKNRETNGRQEGYFYKPHHKIKIREFSEYIEQGDDTVYGVPDYATDLGDGRLLWRDLLSLGFSDVDNVPLDYPFTNGCHYLYDNIQFTLRRQDPFNKYGLYYKTVGEDDPKDPIGDQIDGDEYKINKSCGGC